jgi:creatinine amidohydrolase
LPIGPLEWHSFHLPIGTDALNASVVAHEVAKRVGGVVMPTFYWGTERERPPQAARDLGFSESDYVVGMDFPKNIIPSLYCREEYLALLVRELLEGLVRLQYRLIVIVNGHGALNQVQTLERLAKEFTATSPATVLLQMAWATGGTFELGYGHADAGETSLMMAHFPESVDLITLPPASEPMHVYDFAIVDDATFRGKPQPEHVLPAAADPRLHSSAEMGWREFERAVAEMDAVVRAALQKRGIP